MLIVFYISSTLNGLSKARALGKYLINIDPKQAIKVLTKNDIYVGENKKVRIRSHIKKSKVIICLINTDYLVDCKDEIYFIFNECDFVIPLIINDCRIYGSKFDGLKLLSFPDYKKNNPDKGLEGFWNFVTENIVLRLDHLFAFQKEIEEDRVITAYAGVAYDYDLLIHLDLDEIDMNLKINKINNDILKIKVIGDSMAPVFQNNDIITCKFVHTSIKILRNDEEELSPNLQSEKFYIIETRYQGVLLKSIQYLDNKIFLHSLNRAYSSIILTPDEVITIWEVRSLFRSL